MHPKPRRSAERWNVLLDHNPRMLNDARFGATRIPLKRILKNRITLKNTSPLADPSETFALSRSDGAVRTAPSEKLPSLFTSQFYASFHPRRDSKTRVFRALYRSQRKIRRERSSSFRLRSLECVSHAGTQRHTAHHSTPVRLPPSPHCGDLKIRRRSPSLRPVDLLPILCVQQ